MKLLCCVIALALNGTEEFGPDTWPLTLDAAIRIGLDNSETVRVVVQGKAAIPVGNCFGPAISRVAPVPPQTVDLPRGMRPGRSAIFIQPLNASASIPRFKSEVMAQIRAINREYWNLYEARSALWAAEQNVHLGQAAVNSEEEDAMSEHGCVEWLIDATEHLAKFRKLLADRKTEVKECERKLRRLLGLPEFDGRQLIPTDHPMRDRIVFERNECLELMMENQPDIIEQKATTDLASRKLAGIRKAFAEGKLKPESRVDNNVNLASTKPPSRARLPLANARAAQYSLIRAQAALDDIVRRSTRSLDRALLEVEFAYKEFAKSRRLRVLAEQRLKSQQVDYQEDRITPDHYLDAVENYATLMATEHHHLSAYTAAFAVVSECKGTLLEDQNIIVAEPRAAAGHRGANSESRERDTNGG